MNRRTQPLALAVALAVAAGCGSEAAGGIQPGG